MQGGKQFSRAAIGTVVKSGLIAIGKTLGEDSAGAEAEEAAGTRAAAAQLRLAGAKYKEGVQAIQAARENGTLKGVFKGISANRQIKKLTKGADTVGRTATEMETDLRNRQKGDALLQQFRSAQPNDRAQNSRDRLTPADLARITNAVTVRRSEERP
jgi:hypothetical protein